MAVSCIDVTRTEKKECIHKHYNIIMHTEYLYLEDSLRVACFFCHTCVAAPLFCSIKVTASNNLLVFSQMRSSGYDSYPLKRLVSLANSTSIQFS